MRELVKFSGVVALSAVLSLPALCPIAFAGPAAVAAERSAQNQSRGAGDGAIPSDSIALVRAAYKYLHENPELGKEEFLAADFLRSALRKLPDVKLVDVPGLPTAIIAVLDTGVEGPTAAFRAEMDARKLPTGDEPLAHDPRSKIPRKMHNCGHDAHAAMLLGLAHMAANDPDSFRGTIVFVFQPAEEVAGGADDIVNSGVLKKLGVSQIYAQHVVSEMPVGQLSLTQGTYLAGSSTLSVTIEGTGGHGGIPFQTSDVPLATAKIALALSEWPARHIDIANRPVVISFSQLSSDSGQTNVLPTVGTLKGTLRAFEDPTAPQNEGSLQDQLKTYLDALANAFGVKATLTIRPGAPPTTNDLRLFDSTLNSLKRSWLLGAIDTKPQKFMTSEDFAYYTAATPSVYWGLGIAKDGKGEASVHSEAFTLHPDALEHGLLALVLVARGLPDRSTGP